MKVVNIRKNGKIAEKLFRKNRAKYWFAESDNSDPLKLNIFLAPPRTYVSSIIPVRSILNTRSIGIICAKNANLMVFWLFLRSVDPGRENRAPKNVGNYRCFVHFLRSPTDRSIEVQKHQILVVFWWFFRSVATGRRRTSDVVVVGRHSKINNIDLRLSAVVSYRWQAVYISITQY